LDILCDLADADVTGDEGKVKDVNNTNNSDNNSNSEDRLLQQPVQQNTNISVQDITHMLSRLDSSLQARFVDKLAEVLGAQIMSKVGANANVGGASVGNNGSSSSTQLPVALLNNFLYGVSSPNATTTTTDPVMMEFAGGATAPAEVAMPLANGVLNAFVYKLLEMQNTSAASNTLVRTNSRRVEAGVKAL